MKHSGIVCLTAALFLAGAGWSRAGDEAAQRLERARDLHEDGRLWRARRAYRHTVRNHPHAATAAKAQYKLALLQEERGRYRQAGEAYIKLLKSYAGQAPHADVLQKLFDLGVRLMDERPGSFLFFPGFKTPERAIPFLEAVVRHGPRWEHAPQAQYLIGRIHQQNRKYEEAVAAYNITFYRYSNSPFAEKAAFARAVCRERLAARSPASYTLTEQAWAEFTFFLDAYPHSRFASQAAAYRQDLHDRMAHAAFQRAAFYDRHTRNDHAARTAYGVFLRSFPQSEWAPTAEQRMRKLSGVGEENEAYENES